MGVYDVAADQLLFPRQIGTGGVPPLPEEGVRLSDFPNVLRIAVERTPSENPATLAPSCVTAPADWPRIPSLSHAETVNERVVSTTGPAVRAWAPRPSTTSAPPR